MERSPGWAEKDQHDGLGYRQRFPRHNRIVRSLAILYPLQDAVQDLGPYL